ncbi:MAG: branched-chain-amino-acid transaminase [Abitibacteriaceae bacterium]|nr:branched-chain-amino-acid transaminase [Abditibacteriaceae bacterium]
MQIYLNGELVPKEKATVSVFDHGFLYGDGVFEGIRVYNRRIFRHDAHLLRLYRSAKAIMLDIPLSMQEMKRAVEQTVAANKLENGYIRLIVSRGPGDLGLDPRKCPKPTVIIIADAIKLYPPEVYEQGMEVITAATRRSRPDVLNPAIKSLNYLNNILAKIECIRAGVPECVMLNDQGLVAECSGDNIFIYIRDFRGKAELRTPPVSAGSLEGITRDAVMQIADELSIPCVERDIALFDIYAADEAFLTGTAAEVVPMTKLDNREIGNGKPGELTWRIIQRYRELTQSEGEALF